MQRNKAPSRLPIQCSELGLQNYRGARLQGCMVAVEPRRVVMCGEVSAGILFKIDPTPTHYTAPQAKAGSVIKAGEKNSYSKSLGSLFPKLDSK